MVLLALYWPLSWKNISYKSQLNKLQSLLSTEDITLPLSEWSLKGLNQESQGAIFSIVQELAEKYNKSKVYDKIISYDYDNTHRYSSRSEIRNYLWVDTTTEWYYYNDTVSFSYRQYDKNIWIDISWYSKLYNVELDYDKSWDNTRKINLDNKEYIVSLAEHTSQLLEKADLYRKSDLTNEEKLKLNQPALIIDWENYKLIITWFYWDKNIASGQIKFNYAKWYILAK